MIHVTRHACQRYCERVGAQDCREAKARILAHERTLQIASDFGAPVVRNGDGVGFVVKRGIVMTVLGAGMRTGPVQ